MNAVVAQPNDTHDPPASPAGGGTRPPSTPPLQRRWSDREFQNVLGRGIAAVRKSLMTIGFFSFAVNTFVLAVPVYLFQISDRVLTSHSMDTLVMLTLIVIGALVMHVLIDIVRRFMLMRT